MVPYLRAANVKDGHLDLDDVKEMNFTPAEQQVFSLRPGDVMVTEGSGSLGAVGASAVWQGEIDGTVCFQNTLLRLRPRRMTDGRFLGWWCRHAFADGLFAAIATGANIFHVSAERVRSLPTTYMDLTLQRAIADFLDIETARIDALIAKKRRLIELVDQRLSATISSALWQTSHYDAVRLKYLTGRPTSGNRDHASFTWSDVGVPCLRGLNVRPGRIEHADLLRISQDDHQRHTTTALVPGDVVVVRSGLAGAAAVVPASLGECNCVDLVVIRRSSRLLPRYLELVLNSRETQEEVGLNTAGALLTHFNAVDAGELALPYRSLESQYRIVQLLDGLASESASLGDRLIRQIELLQEHRQALITAAVTGELEVGKAA